MSTPRAHKCILNKECENGWLVATRDLFVTRHHQVSRVRGDRRWLTSRRRSALAARNARTIRCTRLPSTRRARTPPTCRASVVTTTSRRVTVVRPSPSSAKRPRPQRRSSLSSSARYARERTRSCSSAASTSTSSPSRRRRRARRSSTRVPPLPGRHSLLLAATPSSAPRAWL